VYVVQKCSLYGRLYDGFVRTWKSTFSNHNVVPVRHITFLQEQIPRPFATALKTINFFIGFFPSSLNILVGRQSAMHIWLSVHASIPIAPDTL
jgi:hypothetical protein